MASRKESRRWGLPDETFAQRRPLRGQITKREVRAVSLYFMGLKTDSVVWDIGAGTGSISIEAGIVARDGTVYAIERDVESVPLLKQNVAAHGSGNIEIVEGSAPQVLAGLPDPDSVFVGGSGGELEEILDAVAARLKTGATVAANFATLERTNATYRWFLERGFQADISMINAARGRPMPDASVRLEALNPVFVVSARKETCFPEVRADD